MAFLTNSVMADQQGDALVTKTPFDLASKTFEVTAQKTEQCKDITRIDVAVWSEEDGQDDLKWYKATKVGDSSYKATIQLSNHGFDTGAYGVHIYGDNSITNSFEALSGTPGFRVDQISGLENPDVGISNVNTSNGSFKVNVTEKAMSKRVSKVNLKVTSKSNPQKSKTYEAKPSSYGKISQTVDLKSINNQADTFSVTATVIYSDNSTATFNLSDQSYKPTTTPTPRITTYINETNTYPVGQCTWGVKSLAPWIPNRLGNAGGWAVNARAKGFRVGTTPRVGSIVVWPHDGGGYGHVAYVTAVSSNTRIQVKEANYAGKQYIGNFRGWFNPLDSFWGGDVSYIYPD
ncbi:CHAP domain-containing protein [Streptococcus vicugnae]|uniref:CHAP domain-containing protein n=2 Tax=Streptococcus vicugnae TaxID=2740579 RepID=A0A4R5G4L8_9STRE|nr:CHAP domain-containing protein [Streptococcus vicugnae]